jgi:hypothetical protein
MFTSVHGMPSGVHQHPRKYFDGVENPAVAAVENIVHHGCNDGHEKWRAKAILAIFLLARA